jgi:hypothetical protein
MAEQTTITVKPETLERFKTLRSDVTDASMPEPSADVWLNQLLDNWERDMDDVTLAGHGDGLSGIPGDVDALVDALADDGDATGDALDYDDVVQACRQAIREELPVEQMGGR